MLEFDKDIHHSANPVPTGITDRKYQFRRHSTSNTAKGEYVVFKVYEGHDGEVCYNAETDVYMKLHNYSSNCIVKHIASFEFREIMKLVIILEYAEGGSLLDYLRTTRLPVRPEDFYSLWEGLFELLDALLHQDIHLGNILVFPKGKARSPFYAQFKLTDFGLARMGRVSHVDGRLSTRDRGNRTYIAPEVFPNFGVQDSCDTPISPQADIWSLGALFSDVLVWTIVGEDGREYYRRRRKEEI
ncbi:kinase-like domain-containing protein [Fusarium oxysporum]|nr:kinase-like domain-containing protein [Fusarium oxysporum]